MRVLQAKTLLCLALATSATFACSQVIINTSGYQNAVGYPFGGASQQVIAGQGVSLNLPAANSLLKIVLPDGTNWSAYTHLQMNVRNTGSKAEPFFVAIQSTGIWCYTEMMLTPGRDASVIVPLDNVAPTGTFMMPQPPGNLSLQLFPGKPVDKPHVAWMMVMAPDASGPTSLVIHDMRPVYSPIPTTNLVDRYGQQAQINWPGKVNSDTDLVLAGSGILSNQYPYPADSYGGVSGTAIAGSRTGLWHTAKQGGHWYIIDPLGNRFFSSGVVGAGNSPAAIVTGRESAFIAGALPDQNGPFQDHYHQGYDAQGHSLLSFNFYTANAQRKWGTNWRPALTNQTKLRMRTWAFNTAGPSSLLDLQDPVQQTPFAEIASVTGSYQRIGDAFGGGLMPDVFDPAWTTAINGSMAATAARYAGNNYSMGVFVDNELPWAKPFSATNPDYGLCEDVLLSPSTQPAKIALVNWLSSRYSGNIGALNASWGSSYSSFTAILTQATHEPQNVTQGMDQDMRAFTLYFARTYFSTIKRALDQAGYQGLYLGCRLEYFSPEVLQACRESADVVSFNDYQLLPSMHHAELKSLDAPVLISEVGIGACDLGRVPSYPTVLTENDRGSQLSRYFDDAAGWTNLVGIHWYKWEDDVISGRFYDGNNNCLGLVSIADKPYGATIAAARSGNLTFMKLLGLP